MIHRDISDKRLQIDSLDGLRGFAALIVVFSHTSNAGMFFLPMMDLRGTGKSGVFLFFLLSSFLLTLPLLSKGKSIFSFSVMSHYWQRRFFRIYPLYTLYLLLGLLTTAILSTYIGKNVGIPFALDWNQFLRHILLQEGKGVTWSIAVEFKFYFLLPFLAFAIAFLRSIHLGAALFFILALLIASRLIFLQSESIANDSSLLPYMPIFLIGTLLALIQYEININGGITVKAKALSKYLGYIGVIGILIMTPSVISLFGEKFPTNYFHTSFILYSVLWSFILFSSINNPGVIQYLFTRPALRFYGALSFSLYLFHPVFIGIMRYFNADSHLSAWLVLFASTASAYVSFKLIESPASKFKISGQTPLISKLKYKRANSK